MARDFVYLGSSHADEVGLMQQTSGSLILFCMIIMSLSIISMVIFACGDSGSGSPSKKRHGGGHGGHAGGDHGGGVHHGGHHGVHHGGHGHHGVHHGGHGHHGGGCGGGGGGGGGCGGGGGGGGC
ncbi:hypothetical protein L1049_024661 [Liquidambar formosana]|uniref:Uncharacterized protein n=1 Tax=Liquidambar formosana TaxID=63359 RepID=A0AAP0S1D3_LIQFO